MCLYFTRYLCEFIYKKFDFTIEISIFATKPFGQDV